MQYPQTSSNACFCTLAVGNRYRRHAAMLASDLQIHAPTMPLLILTNRVSAFRHFPNVIAIAHRLQSVKGYHDKLFVIEQALSRFEVCTFLDSDMRILGPVPPDLNWAPGLTARHGCNILKHNTTPRVRAALPVIQEVASRLNLNLMTVSWLHEFMFTVRRQSGAELAFLEAWSALSHHFELRGIHDGEGNVMGLAAAIAGLSMQFDRHDRFPIFKDNIERERIKQGISLPDHAAVYFDAHRAIEYQQRMILEKAVRKFGQSAARRYRAIRLKLWMTRRDALLSLEQATLAGRP